MNKLKLFFLSINQSINHHTIHLKITILAILTALLIIMTTSSLVNVQCSKSLFGNLFLLDENTLGAHFCMSL